MSVLVTLKATAVAAVLAASTVAGVSAAHADATAPAPSTGTGQLGAACHHVEKQLTRATKLSTRLHADASTKGSIAFLQARIDQANHNGQTALARVLTDRMAVRKQIDGQLPEVISHLTDAKAACTTAGVPA
jgi:hypothetical protein